MAKRLTGRSVCLLPCRALSRRGRDELLAIQRCIAMQVTLHEAMREFRHGAEDIGRGCLWLARCENREH